MANSRSTVRFPSPSVEDPGEATSGRAPSLHTVIVHAIDTARSQGLDEQQQYDRAVSAGMGAGRDSTLLAVSRLINRILESRDQRGW